MDASGALNSCTDVDSFPLLSLSEITGTERTVDDGDA